MTLRRLPPLRVQTSKRVPPAAVKALFRATGWTEDIAGYSPQQIRKLLGHSHLVLSAWDGKKLVGFATAVSDGTFCGMVQNLVIHPDYRGGGLGTRILRQLAARMKREGVSCLYALGARDPGARTFFRRVGFQPLNWSVFVRHTR